jgi:Uncharacterized protein conserved in bacteria (DUF2188)
MRREIRASTYRGTTMAAKRYVRESGGGWEVLREGDRRATIRSDTRDKAVARARAILEDQGGGEIRVVNRAGKIVESSKVAGASSKHAVKRA